MAKILVIEDNKDLLELFVLLLNQLNYKVHSASTKEELFKELKTVKPDLILLDLDFWFVRENICDICSDLHPHVNEYKTPVIFLSTDRDKLKNRYEIVPDAVIDKPFRITEVVNKIKAILKKRKLVK